MSDESSPGEAARQGRPSVSQRLREMGVERRWIHHVASLETGELVSAEFDRPPTPAERAERLAHFVPHGPTPFGGPSYALTARVPYQAEPEAMLFADWAASFNTDANTIEWFTEDPTAALGGLYASFANAPGVRSVVSVLLWGGSWPNETGQVQVAVADVAATVTVPVPGVGSQAIDVVFQAAATVPTVVSVAFMPGIQNVTFHLISFGPLLPEPVAWPELG